MRRQLIAKIDHPLPSDACWSNCYAVSIISCSSMENGSGYYLGRMIVRPGRDLVDLARSLVDVGWSVAGYIGEEERLRLFDEDAREPASADSFALQGRA